jgi:hypothetical protein
VVLEYLYKNAECEAALYGEIKWQVALTLNKFSGPDRLPSHLPQYGDQDRDKQIQKSFLSSFSRSLSGLCDKDLVEWTSLKIMDLDFPDFCRFWAFHTNFIDMHYRRLHVVDLLSDPRTAMKWSDVPGLFSGIEKLLKTESSRYSLSEGGLRLMRSGERPSTS